MHIATTFAVSAAAFMLSGCFEGPQGPPGSKGDVGTTGAVGERAKGEPGTSHRALFWQ